MRRRSRAGPERAKSRRRKTVTQKRRGLRNPSAADHKTQSDVAQFIRERDEALEREKATAEVLRVISSSPGELEPVFQAMLANAVRICEAKFGTLYRFNGELFHLAAQFGTPPKLAAFQRKRGPFLPLPGSSFYRAMRTKQACQTADLAAQATLGPPAKFGGARSFVGVPMLKDGVLIGTFNVYRQEVRPFTDKQIELLTNFAAQAVIAIENTRLLNELRQRTTDLTESLEQQTATTEVLGVISSSPGELEPVFQSMLENATRICGANFGSLSLYEGDYTFRAVAVHGAAQDYAEERKREPVIRRGPGTMFGDVVESKRPVHITDLAARPELAPTLAKLGARTLLIVPMLKEHDLIGTINIYRYIVQPFTDKQIELVQNFAAQAVIAIENTRLLNELRQSLEQQTATADVLRVISSSPGELEPVFQAMLENAVRICDAKFGALYRCDNETFTPAALFGAPPAYAEFVLKRSSFRPAAGVGLDRLLRTKDVVRITDDAAESAQSAPSRFGGARSLIVVPMLKDDEFVGAFSIFRQEVRPFSDKQVELVQNFAAQAVIAIENTRLLNELRERTADLTESLEQQTATADVLRVISNSPGDLEPVFETMLASARRICKAEFGILYLCEGDGLRAVAMHNVPPVLAEARKRGVNRPDPRTGVGLAVKTRKPVQIPDLSKEQAYLDGHPHVVASVELGGIRTTLNVPMLKEDQLIGAIVIYRQKVQPFEDKQIELVQNFAAQAVIAIENTRLLNELRRALEQQTATSKVLSVISSSPGELEPVFQAMLENAVRICEAAFGSMLLREGDGFRRVALHNAPLEYAKFGESKPLLPPTKTLARILETMQAAQVADMAVAEPQSPISRLGGARTLLNVPMIRENELIGVFAVFRQEVRPFTDKQIELVQNFAAQAVIAIENTRLLNELR